MTKKKIKELIAEAARDLKVASVYRVSDGYYINLIPLKASDRLFLSIHDDDFIFNGFRISRFRDVEKVQIKSDKCDEIIRKEGLWEGFQAPEIDVKNWQTVFESLKEMGNNIIVKYEYETPEEKAYIFTIGKIKCVYKNCLYMYHFNADGTWDIEPYRIPYTEVTSVTFNSRYVDIFSKYIPEAPSATDRSSL